MVLAGNEKHCMGSAAGFLSTWKQVREDLTALPIFVVQAVSPSRTKPMKLLTNSETAAILDLKPNTLEIWRIQGKGPVFRKIGRAVRYVESDVLAWIEAQTCASTSEYHTRQRGKLASV